MISILNQTFAFSFFKISIVYHEQFIGNKLKLNKCKIMKTNLFNSDSKNILMLSFETYPLYIKTD